MQLIPLMDEGRHACSGCGECCLKGGPVLHEADFELIKSGLFKPEAFLTIRVGEIVHYNQNINDGTEAGHAPLNQEMIKAAAQSTPGRPWHCLFHNITAGCSVYASRPAQCRALFCSTPRSLDKVLASPRLSRNNVLPLFSPTWRDLAQAHEEDCPISRLTEPAFSGHKDGLAELAELLRLDAAFRNITIERGLAPAKALPLIFGRDLKIVLNDLKTFHQTGINKS